MVTGIGLRAAIVLAVMLVAGGIGAAEPSVEVFLQPTTFGVEDLAQLTVRVSEPPAELGAPAFEGLDNLELVQGPSTGSEFRFVNGVASRSQTFTYLVRALAPGPVAIARVTVAAGAATLETGPVTGEAVPGSVVGQQRRQRRSPFGIDPFADLMPRRAPPSVKVVLRHLLSDTSISVGEPLVATVVLDSTASSLYDFNWKTAPSYPGFWAQRLDNPEQVTPEVVEIDGVAYYRYRVMRSVLVPLKPGSLEIPAVEAVIGVRSRSFFDPGQLIERTAAARLLEVGPRPDPPPGFAGAVGDLRYHATIEPAEIAFGESAVLTITLQGRGNLPLVEPPSPVPGADGCDVYPPEEVDEVVVDDSGIHGSRSWQMTVIPRTWGEIELGAVELAVYDPEARAYVPQTVGPLKLTVGPPPPTPTPAVTPPVDDRRRGEAGRVEPDDGGSVSRWLWIAAALLLGLAAGSAATWAIGRRARVALPPRRADQSPADRARILQLTLERWWLDVRDTDRGRRLEDEMAELRRDLEAVRFAPGRADHSDTVIDLEDRLRRLVRRA